ncbi:unnamed protein product [Amoebophrya sp. A120]|nr:unnamed protein product [Amoebophrya sp. A120]|eukprot:GSA120T00015470001.1
MSGTEAEHDGTGAPTGRGAGSSTLAHLPDAAFMTPPPALGHHYSSTTNAMSTPTPRLAQSAHASLGATSSTGLQLHDSAGPTSTAPAAGSNEQRLYGGSSNSTSPGGELHQGQVNHATGARRPGDHLHGQNLSTAKTPPPSKQHAFAAGNSSTSYIGTTTSTTPPSTTGPSARGGQHAGAATGYERGSWGAGGGNSTGNKNVGVAGVNPPPPPAPLIRGHHHAAYQQRFHSSSSGVNNTSSSGGLGTGTAATGGAAGAGQHQYSQQQHPNSVNKQRRVRGEQHLFVEESVLKLNLGESRFRQRDLERWSDITLTENNLLLDPLLYTDVRVDLAGNYLGPSAAGVFYFTQRLPLALHQRTTLSLAGNQLTGKASGLVSDMIELGVWEELDVSCNYFENGDLLDFVRRAVFSGKYPKQVNMPVAAKTELPSSSVGGTSNALQEPPVAGDNETSGKNGYHPVAGDIETSGKNGYHTATNQNATSTAAPNGINQGPQLLSNGVASGRGTPTSARTRSVPLLLRLHSNHEAELEKEARAALVAEFGDRLQFVENTTPGSGTGRKSSFSNKNLDETAGRQAEFPPMVAVLIDNRFGECLPAPRWPTHSSSSLAASGHHHAHQHHHHNFQNYNAHGGAGGGHHHNNNYYTSSGGGAGGPLQHLHGGAGGGPSHHHATTSSHFYHQQHYQQTPAGASLMNGATTTTAMIGAPASTSGGGTSAGVDTTHGGGGSTGAYNRGYHHQHHSYSYPTSGTASSTSGHMYNHAHQHSNYHAGAAGNINSNVRASAAGAAASAHYHTAGSGHGGHHPHVQENQMHDYQGSSYNHYAGTTTTATSRGGASGRAGSPNFGAASAGVSSGGVLAAMNNNLMHQQHNSSFYNHAQDQQHHQHDPTTSLSSQQDHQLSQHGGMQNLQMSHAFGGNINPPGGGGTTASSAATTNYDQQLHQQPMGGGAPTTTTGNAMSTNAIGAVVGNNPLSGASAIDGAAGGNYNNQHSSLQHHMNDFQHDHYGTMLGADQTQTANTTTGSTSTNVVPPAGTTMNSFVAQHQQPDQFYNNQAAPSAGQMDYYAAPDGMSANATGGSTFSTSAAFNTSSFQSAGAPGSAGSAAAAAMAGGAASSMMGNHQSGAQENVYNVGAGAAHQPQQISQYPPPPPPPALSGLLAAGAGGGAAAAQIGMSTIMSSNSNFFYPTTTSNSTKTPNANAGGGAAATTGNTPNPAVVQSRRGPPEATTSTPPPRHQLHQQVDMGYNANFSISSLATPTKQKNQDQQHAHGDGHHAGDQHTSTSDQYNKWSAGGTNFDDPALTSTAGSASSVLHSKSNGRRVGAAEGSQHIMTPSTAGGPGGRRGDAEEEMILSGKDLGQRDRDVAGGAPQGRGAGPVDASPYSPSDLVGGSLAQSGSGGHSSLHSTPSDLETPHIIAASSGGAGMRFAGGDGFPALSSGPQRDREGATAATGAEKSLFPGTNSTGAPAAESLQPASAGDGSIGAHQQQHQNLYHAAATSSEFFPATVTGPRGSVDIGSSTVAGDSSSMFGGQHGQIATSSAVHQMQMFGPAGGAKSAAARAIDNWLRGESLIEHPEIHLPWEWFLPITSQRMPEYGVFQLLEGWRQASEWDTLLQHTLAETLSWPTCLDELTRRAPNLQDGREGFLYCDPLAFFVSRVDVAMYEFKPELKERTSVMMWGLLACTKSLMAFHNANVFISYRKFRIALKLVDAMWLEDPAVASDRDSFVELIKQRTANILYSAALDPRLRPAAEAFKYVFDEKVSTLLRGAKVNMTTGDEGHQGDHVVLAGSSILFKNVPISELSCRFACTEKSVMRMAQERGSDLYSCFGICNAVNWISSRRLRMLLSLLVKSSGLVQMDTNLSCITPKIWRFVLQIYQQLDAWALGGVFMQDIFN